MKEAVAIAKEADTKKDFSSARSCKSAHRVSDEPERQLCSLRSVINNIRSDGGMPSVDSIANELSRMPSAQRVPVMLALQRTRGNQYVQRVVAGIQAKNKVGLPGAIYNQGAERVADHRRQLEEEDLQIKESSGKAAEVTLNLESLLPESEQGLFEPPFGYDFGGVRTHTDSEAVEAVQAINARAFAVGRDAVFGAGQYSPETPEGEKLLRHVVQQTGDIVRRKFIIGPQGERIATYLSGNQQGNPLFQGRCPRGGSCPPNPLVDYQGSGRAWCDTASGTMRTAITEHCAGNCVAQHEAIHVRDRGDCCSRVKTCLDNAGGDAARQTACRTAFNTWYPQLSDWTECNAYGREVTCLTTFINNNCNGRRRATTGAIIGGAIGGILGGIGGFLVGGPVGAVVGAVGGAAVGAGVGFLAGRVSAACCNTLRNELTFATNQRTARCAAAVNVPCPFRANGTII